MNPTPEQQTTPAAESSRRAVLRTLTLLLAEAMDEPQHLKLAYSVGDGYFFHVTDQRPLMPGEVAKLAAHIRRRVGQDTPVQTRRMKRGEALELLHSRGRSRTLAWLADRPGRLPTVAPMNGDLLLFDGPLLERTGQVGEWELRPYPPGILLRIPPKGVRHLEPAREMPGLFRTFYQNEHWASVHGVNYVSEVNDRLRAGEPAAGELIRICEAVQEKAIARIADQIAATLPRPRVVLVSGPSASGKTTFSMRLATHLRLLGMRPHPLGLDDFYLSRSNVPRTPAGDYDFEALEALDIPLFNEVLLRLVAGERVALPRLNFRTHRRERGPEIELGESGILVVEGIHGLNPELTPHLTAASVFKVYVSALTSLNFDRFNRVSTADLRLLRRIVRDRRSRGYPANDTLARWPAVRAGELRNIFPYQEQADAMFNSALPYELNALRRQALEALREAETTPFRAVARRLRSQLEVAAAMEPGLLERHLPPTSILAEFTGGSVLVP